MFSAAAAGDAGGREEAGLRCKDLVSLCRGDLTKGLDAHPQWPHGSCDPGAVRSRVAGDGDGRPVELFELIRQPKGLQAETGAASRGEWPALASS